MKKYLLLFAAAAVALGAAAGQMGKKTVPLFKAERTNLEATATQGLNRAPITTQPAGEAMEYEVSMQGVYVSNGYYTPANPLEGATTIVFGENGAVYFKNILLNGDNYGDTWVKGALSEDGKKITVATEQSIYYSISYAADVNLRWETTAVSNGSLVFTSDLTVTTVTFNVDEDGVISLEGGVHPGTGTYANYEGTGLGCQWTDNNSFGGFLAWGLTFTPAMNLNATNIEVEAGADCANVLWEGNDATSWSLRYRVKGDGQFWDFSDQAQFEGWQTVDADGDGYNWEYTRYEDGGSMLGSASYDNETETPLEPDNWLIAPAVTIKAGDKVSFKAWAQDPNWSAEHFAVYATNGDPSDLANFTQVSEEIVATGTPTEYSYDLSAFAGEAYVAFRHFNVTDQFRLNLDDVAIGTIYDWVQIDDIAEPTYAIEGLDPATDYELQIKGYDGSLEGEWSQSAEFTTLEADAEFYVVGAFNEWNVANGVKFEADEDGVLSATFDAEGEAESLEFKIATPDDEAEEAAQGMKWFGGVDEYENYFCLVTEELLGQNMTVVSPGANFRLPAAGNFTILLMEAEDNGNGAPKKISADSELSIIVLQNGVTAVADLNMDRAAGVHYVNLAGQVSSKPFNGVNIMVTTMKDGSKKAVKVVK
ncbi:MAG: choice-of-anchor J domain-containing protein [Muribaculaceae bacterium]|nr:choice-of-anchor J domain-containing protein [Muribaculaceae bacterium]